MSRPQSLSKQRDAGLVLLSIEGLVELQQCGESLNPHTMLHLISEHARREVSRISRIDLKPIDVSLLHPRHLGMVHVDVIDLWAKSVHEHAGASDQHGLLGIESSLSLQNFSTAARTAEGVEMPPSFRSSSLNAVHEIIEQLPVSGLECSAQAAYVLSHTKHL